MLNLDDSNTLVHSHRETLKLLQSLVFLLHFCLRCPPNFHSCPAATCMHAWLCGRWIRGLLASSAFTSVSYFSETNKTYSYLWHGIGIRIINWGSVGYFHISDNVFTKDFVFLPVRPVILKLQDQFCILWEELARGLERGWWQGSAIEFLVLDYAHFCPVN